MQSRKLIVLLFCAQLLFGALIASGPPEEDDNLSKIVYSSSLEETSPKDDDDLSGIVVHSPSLDETSPDEDDHLSKIVVHSPSLEETSPEEDDDLLGIVVHSPSLKETSPEEDDLSEIAVHSSCLKETSPEEDNDLSEIVVHSPCLEETSSEEYNDLSEIIFHMPGLEEISMENLGSWPLEDSENEDNEHPVMEYLKVAFTIIKTICSNLFASYSLFSQPRTILVGTYNFITLIMTWEPLFQFFLQNSSGVLYSFSCLLINITLNAFFFLVIQYSSEIDVDEHGLGYYATIASAFINFIYFFIYLKKFLKLMKEKNEKLFVK